MCRQSASMPSFSLRASRSAPQTASASLASSDGWTWSGPSWIQRAAPFCTCPTPWISVSARPITAMATSGYAAARNSRGDERATSHMTGRPITTPASCRSKS